MACVWLRILLTWTVSQNTELLSFLIIWPGSEPILASTSCLHNSIMLLFTDNIASHDEYLVLVSSCITQNTWHRLISYWYHAQMLKLSDIIGHISILISLIATNRKLANIKKLRSQRFISLLCIAPWYPNLAITPILILITKNTWQSKQIKSRYQTASRCVNTLSASFAIQAVHFLLRKSQEPDLHMEKYSWYYTLATRMHVTHDAWVFCLMKRLFLEQSHSATGRDFSTWKNA